MYSWKSEVNEKAMIFKKKRRAYRVCLAFVYARNISIKALKIIRDVMCGDREVKNGFVNQQLS